MEKLSPRVDSEMMPTRMMIPEMVNQVFHRPQKSKEVSPRNSRWKALWRAAAISGLAYRRPGAQTAPDPEDAGVREASVSTDQDHRRPDEEEGREDVEDGGETEHEGETPDVPDGERPRG